MLSVVHYSDNSHIYLSYFAGNIPIKYNSKQTEITTKIIVVTSLFTGSPVIV